MQAVFLLQYCEVVLSGRVYSYCSRAPIHSRSFMQDVTIQVPCMVKGSGLQLRARGLSKQIFKSRDVGGVLAFCVG